MGVFFFVVVLPLVMVSAFFVIDGLAGNPVVNGNADTERGQLSAADEFKRRRYLEKHYGEQDAPNLCAKNAHCQITALPWNVRSDDERPRQNIYDSRAIYEAANGIVRERTGRKVEGSYRRRSKMDQRQTVGTYYDWSAWSNFVDD